MRFMAHGILLQVLISVFLMTATMASNGGLLSSTLFTFQERACEGDHLHIRCPEGTTISVQFAQYGRQIPSHQLCPPRSSGGQGQHSSNVKVNWNEDTNCISPSSLQVLLDECQDQRKCHVQASTPTFGPDPCRGTSKYLEVAYKCRPNEFHSRITCEGEKMQLWCEKSTRIAVYSAMFGRGEHGTLECPATSRGSKIECQSDYTLEEVMQRCHGKRKCRLPASEAIFGDPCTRGTQKYLNVVYTCVPKKILKSLQRTRIPSDTSPSTIGLPASDTQRVKPDSVPGRRKHNKKRRRKKNKNRKNRKKNRNRDKSRSVKKDKDRGIENGEAGFFPEISTVNLKNVLTYTTAPAVKDQPSVRTTNTTKLNCMNETTGISISASKSRDGIGFLTNWISTAKFLGENKEKFILYFTVSMVLGLALLLLIIIFRLVYLRRRDASQGKLDVTEPIPSPLHTLRPNCSIRMRVDDRTFTSDTSRSDQTDNGTDTLRQNSHAQTLRNEFRGTTFRNDYGNGVYENSNSNAFRNDFRNDSLRRDPGTMRSLNHYYG
ncbi:unnamed protein product [Owenia fusiformis]|uniref:Uncharacterized protein n=1 Tax=Owenia fusiformis TaxID=6347 RepID=A0A8J1TE86_OWEFU|nr:unnamed protein product [Owenia fusiformis]